MSLEVAQQPTDTGAPAAPDARQDQGGQPQKGAEPGGKPAERELDRRTLAEGGGSEKETATVEPRWRDDWREAMAGGDEDFRKVLSRFQSPEGVAKSFREANAKIRAGLVKEPLPEKPTDEQLARFRKDNGIPDAADGYKVEPGGGFVFGEEDKAGLDALRAYGHERHWTPTQVNQVAGLYAELTEKTRAAQDVADAAYREESQETLRQELGRDFRPAMQNIRNMLGRHGEQGLAEHLMGSRGPDGRLLGDHPGFIRLLGTLAREMNPLDTVVPAGTADAGKAVAEELLTLRGMMRDDPEKFYKAEGGKYVGRYRQLLEAEGKQKARG